jgi:hypothetical protein
MTYRRGIAPIIALALLASTAGEAWAKPVTYRLGFVASGVADGKPFTDEEVEVRLKADTSQVTVTPDVTTLTLDCSPSLCGGYIAGIGFGIASIYKFRQHKKNPTEIKVQVSGRNNANVTLTKQRLASYKLGEPLAPVEVKVAFKAPLTFRGSMVGRPTTVTFTSIKGRSLTLEAE